MVVFARTRNRFDVALRIVHQCVDVDIVFHHDAVVILRLRLELLVELVLLYGLLHLPDDPEHASQQEYAVEGVAMHLHRMFDAFGTQQ
jgi:hypothetical protein